MAIAHCMREQKLTVDAIPQNLYTVLRHNMDISFLLDCDFEEFPYGVRTPGPGWAMKESTARDIQECVFHLIENHQVLIQQLAEDACHFASEYPNETLETFNAHFTDWFLTYFPTTGVGTQYCQALKTVAYHFCMNIQADEDQLHFVWFNIWAYIKPVSTFPVLNVRDGFVLKGLEYLYDDEADIDDMYGHCIG